MHSLTSAVSSRRRKITSVFITPLRSLPVVVTVARRHFSVAAEVTLQRACYQLRAVSDKYKFTGLSPFSAADTLFLAFHLFLYLWWPISLKIKSACHQRIQRYSVISELSTDSQSLCACEHCLHQTLLLKMHPPSEVLFSSGLVHVYLCFLPPPSLVLSPYLSPCSFSAYLLDCFHFADLFPMPLSFQLPVPESLSVCVHLSSYLQRKPRER